MTYFEELRKMNMPVEKMEVILIMIGGLILIPLVLMWRAIKGVFERWIIDPTLAGMFFILDRSGVGPWLEGKIDEIVGLDEP